MAVRRKKHRKMPHKVRAHFLAKAILAAKRLGITPKLNAHKES